MKKKIFIFGHTGYLGSYLLKHLSNDSFVTFGCKIPRPDNINLYDFYFQFINNFLSENNDVFCLINSAGSIDCQTQEEAVSLVRKEMLTLNQIVLDAFAKRGISTHKLPPHEWARNTGSNFHGNITQLFNNNNSVEITFGDVVDCDEGSFGILSGDDLVVRLAVELPGVQRLVFAIKGVDGILRVPPEQADDKGEAQRDLLRIVAQRGRLAHERRRRDAAQVRGPRYSLDPPCRSVLRTVG